MKVVAVIGCGRIADAAHFPALSQIEEVRIKYACDIITEKAEKMICDWFLRLNLYSNCSTTTSRLIWRFGIRLRILSWIRFWLWNNICVYAFLQKAQILDYLCGGSTCCYCAMHHIFLHY